MSSDETAIPDPRGLLGCAGPLPDVDVPDDAIQAAMDWDARDGCLLPDRHWFAGMLAAALPVLRRHIAAELQGYVLTDKEKLRASPHELIQDDAWIQAVRVVRDGDT